MRLTNHFYLWISGLFLIACQSTSPVVINQQPTEADFTVAFGSCYNQELPIKFWDDVLDQNPDVWIWGGDNVYSDTDDPQKLKEDFQKVLDNPEYQKLQQSSTIIGTWDDHDYGLNDGGKEWHAKDQNQAIFLDFLGVTDIERLQRKGVYHSQTFATKKGKVKVLLLDTRYHRDTLLPSTDPKRRYDPHMDKNLTMLGQDQWDWLQNELIHSDADYNIIVSSIQILSDKHGFESWGNFPHETEKLLNAIKMSQAKGVILLSGDRHISEFSMRKVDGISYPIVDFTSSGLTHTYEAFSGENNPDRVGDVIKVKSFGVLKFNFDTGECKMEMIDENGKTLNTLVKIYK